MKFAKKSVLVGMFVFLAVMVFAVAANAAPAASVESVGLVDMFAVLNQHPKMEATQKELAGIARKKEEEAKAAADKEADQAKKVQVVQAKRMELSNEEQKLMEPIYQECQQAVRVVAVNKKLTLVINKSAVLIGGVEITQDVVLELQKMNASGKAKPKK